MAKTQYSITQDQDDAWQEMAGKRYVNLVRENDKPCGVTFLLQTLKSYLGEIGVKVDLIRSARAQKKVELGADMILVDDADTLPQDVIDRAVGRVALLPDSERNIPRLIIATKKPVGDPAFHVVCLRRDYWSDKFASNSPANMSFIEWITTVKPDYRWFRYSKLMANQFQRAVDGDGDFSHVLLEAPPGMGKSLLAAQLLPAYYLVRYPDRNVAIGTGDRDLAKQHSKSVRNFYRASGGETQENSDTVGWWETTEGGSLWVTSVGSGLLGKRYHLGIVDDPFPSYEISLRISEQEKVKRWWDNDFYFRHERIGGVPITRVLMHQRLCNGDLAGRILDEESRQENNLWKVIYLPAIQPEKEAEFPKSCDVIKLEREVGEVLDEDADSLENVLSYKRKNAISFQALYQQDPIDEKSSGVFDKDLFGILEGMEVQPDNTVSKHLEALEMAESIKTIHRQVRAWDFAGSSIAKRDADFTVSVRTVLCGDRVVGVMPDEIIHVHMTRDKFRAADVVGQVVEMAVSDGPGVDVVIPQEPGAAGIAWVTDIKQKVEAAMTAYYGHSGRVIVYRTSGNKYSNAAPHAGAVKAGRVHLLPGQWVDEFLREHHLFTGKPSSVDRHDDIVDAAAAAFNEIDVLKNTVLNLQLSWGPPTGSRSI